MPFRQGTSFNQKKSSVRPSALAKKKFNEPAGLTSLQSREIIEDSTQPTLEELKEFESFSRKFHSSSGVTNQAKATSSVRDGLFLILS